MKKPVQLLGLFIVLWIISGCASAVQYVPLPDQSKSVEDPNKARIYVLRPTSFGGAIGIPISDGRNSIGITGPNSFLSWERDPGETTIRSMSENTYELPITMKKGLSYYIQQEINIGFFTPRSTLNILPEDEGKRKLSECKPPEIKQ